MLRYEAMRMLQFLFSLALIFGAFALGVFAGWYRWGPRAARNGDAEQADTVAGDERAWGDRSGATRSTLFSPQGGAWSPEVDGAPFPGEADASPSIVLAKELAIDLRVRPAPIRGELTSGGRWVPTDDPDDAT